MSQHETLYYPVMTTAERTALAPTQDGCVVFDSDLGTTMTYAGATWVAPPGSASGPAPLMFARLTANAITSTAGVIVDGVWSIEFDTGTAAGMSQVGTTPSFTLPPGTYCFTSLLLMTGSGGLATFYDATAAAYFGVPAGGTNAKQGAGMAYRTLAVTSTIELRNTGISAEYLGSAVGVTNAGASWMAVTRIG